MKLLTIVGTRPEAIKMAPVLRTLQRRGDVRSILVSTGQHRDLLEEPLAFFGLAADLCLGLMSSGEAPVAFVERATAAIMPTLERERPDWVLVQGDTSSALAGARAAHRLRVPIAHVEAGLRTYRPEPWPEEAFRCEIDRLAGLLLAPTTWAARNLEREKLGGTIRVTGNSGIDALHLVLGRLAEDEALRSRCDGALPPLQSDLPLILATLHRRESAGAGAEALCSVMLEVASAGRAQVAVPVHPNAIGTQLRERLERRSGIYLLPPLGYPELVRMMQRSDLILTDSGGLQEEAPTIGIPVLVLREVTERPEGVEMGLAELVGLAKERISETAQDALARRAAVPPRRVMANPYGDGLAAERIVASLLGEPFRPFGLPPAPAAVARIAV